MRQQSWPVEFAAFLLTLSICLLGIALSVNPAGAVLMRDEPSGFDGHPWGASPADCAALSFVKSMGTTESGKRVEIYERTSGSFLLNGVPFSRIRYRFIGDRLESVQLSFEGRANREKLLQWVEDHYGPVTAGERKLTPKVEWDGYESIVDLSYNIETGTGSLWFLSTGLFHEFSEISVGAGGRQ